jgi:hypothetical protein
MKIAKKSLFYDANQLILLEYSLLNPLLLFKVNFSIYHFKNL